MFLGSRNSMALSGRLDVETGNEKFKMVAALSDVPVSQLLHKVAENFQRLTIYFRWCPSQWNIFRHTATVRYVAQHRNSRRRKVKPEVLKSSFVLNLDTTVVNARSSNTDKVNLYYAVIKLLNFFCIITVIRETLGVWEWRSIIGWIISCAALQSRL
jgi:hypothetical protein